MGDVVELEVPARADYLAIVRLVVTAVAHLFPEYDDEQVDDLRLAVSEACTNAMEAHRANRTDAHVTIRCDGNADRLEVLVSDRGGGFDPEHLKPPPPVTDPNRLEFERGLGIPLIRALADECHFSSSGEGTAVRLVMRPAMSRLQLSE